MEPLAGVVIVGLCGNIGGGFDDGVIFATENVMVGSSCIIAIRRPAQPSCPTCQPFFRNLTGSVKLEGSASTPGNRLRRKFALNPQSQPEFSADRRMLVAMMSLCR